MQKSEIKPGTPVIYWKVIQENGAKNYGLKTAIKSAPWALGSADKPGATVCFVVGIVGGVDIEHIEPLTPETLELAKKQPGYSEIPDAQIAQALNPAGIDNSDAGPLGQVTFNARFTGENSLGYVKGNVYKLILTGGNKITRQDGTGACEYESLTAFFNNWRAV